jgi:hypothetical protein
MSGLDWAALAVAISTIVGSFVASIKWLVKHYLSELKPDGNGGHNFEGRLARLEKRIDDIYQILLEGK